MILSLHLKMLHGKYALTLHRKYTMFAMHTVLYPDLFIRCINIYTQLSPKIA